MRLNESTPITFTPTLLMFYKKKNRLASNCVRSHEQPELKIVAWSINMAALCEVAKRSACENMANVEYND